MKSDVMRLRREHAARPGDFPLHLLSIVKARVVNGRKSISVGRLAWRTNTFDDMGVFGNGTMTTHFVPAFPNPFISANSLLMCNGPMGTVPKMGVLAFPPVCSVDMLCMVPNC